MSIARRYNPPVAARKRSSAAKAAPKRKRSVVPHEHAALKLGVGGDREWI